MKMTVENRGPVRIRAVKKFLLLLLLLFLLFFFGGGGGGGGVSGPLAWKYCLRTFGSSQDNIGREILFCSLLLCLFLFCLLGVLLFLFLFLGGGGGGGSQDNFGLGILFGRGGGGVLRKTFDICRTYFTIPVQS